MDKPLRMLVIGGSKVDFLRIKSHLQREGFSARLSRPTSSGELPQAPDAWDVILADCSVTQIDAGDCLKTIRNALPDIPVILLSGPVGEEKVAGLLKQGFSDFVRKDDLAGLVPAIAASLRETADRRGRREPELQAEHERDRLRFALAAACMGVWERDLRSDECYWSPECLDILGMQRPHGTWDSFTSLLHPDEANRVKLAMQRAIVDKQVSQAEYRCIRPDGRIVWIASVARALYDTAGNPLKLVGTAKDITANKETEGALRESELNYRNLFETSHDIIVFVDRAGNILDINPRGAELTGYSLSDLRRMNVFQHLIVPEDLPLMCQVIKDALDGRERIYQERWKGKEGKIIYLDGLTVPRRSRDGEIISTFCTLRDMTEHKLADEALRLSAQELQESNIAMRVLLRQREKDQRDLEEKINANVEQLVLPFIALLKKSKSLLPEDQAYLKMLESNLKEIISPFTIGLSRKIGGLTPKEILVADFVKEGRHDKEIALALNLSIDTIKAHRRSIRKKLGISRQKTNLRAYLSSFINNYII